MIRNTNIPCFALRGNKSVRLSIRRTPDSRRRGLILLSLWSLCAARLRPGYNRQHRASGRGEAAPVCGLCVASVLFVLCSDKATMSPHSCRIVPAIRRRRRETFSCAGAMLSAEEEAAAPTRTSNKPARQQANASGRYFRCAGHAGGSTWWSGDPGGCRCFNQCFNLISNLSRLDPSIFAPAAAPGEPCSVIQA